MNQLTLLTALKILTNSGIVTERNPLLPPPMPIKKSTKYHRVVLNVSTPFGQQIVVGDVVTHLSFGEYCRLNKAEILTPPAFYSAAEVGEQTNLG